MLGFYSAAGGFPGGSDDAAPEGDQCHIEVPTGPGEEAGQASLRACSSAMCHRDPSALGWQAKTLLS